jgi:predicted secreted Zn-dependent protease
VQTKVKIDITLPAWQNENTGSAETRTQWQRYVAALTRHEQGHRQHGVDAAHEIDNAIGTLPPTGNCDALGTKANAAGSDIIRKYNQRDLDYDRDTRHGATQGARFP